MLATPVPLVGTIKGVQEQALGVWIKPLRVWIKPLGI